MSAPRLLVLKLGTKILTSALTPEEMRLQQPRSGVSESLENSGATLALPRLFRFLTQVLEARQKGWQTIIVTSGAVGLGRATLGLKGELTTSQKQACASVGQSQLMQSYQDLLQQLSSSAGNPVTAAQILLTAQDLADRQKYLNLGKTLQTLLDLQVLPVLNENDVLSDKELLGSYEQQAFGDNDQLAALVAVKLQADLLLLVTDVDGIYTANPAADPNARKLRRLIPDAHGGFTDSGNSSVALSLDGVSSGGRGGMSSKLEAAKKASMCGVATIIASGFDNQVVTSALDRLQSIETQADNEKVGTFIDSGLKIKDRRSRWLAFGAGTAGSIVVNAGAKRALVSFKSSLLAIGIESILGDFAIGDVISISTADNEELGRGRVRASAQELRLVMGLHTSEIQSKLNRPLTEIIHRDDLVMFVEAEDGR
jgi:glutamate 5-kinase